MPKITFIGAGSTVFAKNLLGDILSYPELAQATISLHDIDPERLRTSEIVARKIAEALGAQRCEAPLGRAVLGKREGDEVSIQVAPIRQQFEVLRVH